MFLFEKDPLNKLIQDLQQSGIYETRKMEYLENLGKASRFPTRTKET